MEKRTADITTRDEKGWRRIMAINEAEPKPANAIKLSIRSTPKGNVELYEASTGRRLGNVIDLDVKSHMDGAVEFTVRCLAQQPEKNTPTLGID